ncbi:MAG TPA: DUF1674 domain-containing protein [Acetobacteraceae bacterium]
MDEKADAAASRERKLPKSDAAVAPAPEWPKEIGGPSGPEPTRYGDWEHKGRCSDF